MIKSAKQLVEMGYNLFATEGTAEFFKAHDVAITPVHKPSVKTAPNVVDMLKDGKIDLTIAVPKGFSGEELTDGYHIRRTTVDFGIGLITNVQCAALLVDSMKMNEDKPFLMNATSISDYYDSSGFTF